MESSTALGCWPISFPKLSWLCLLVCLGDQHCVAQQEAANHAVGIAASSAGPCPIPLCQQQSHQRHGLGVGGRSLVLLLYIQQALLIPSSAAQQMAQVTAFNRTTFQGKTVFFLACCHQMMFRASARSCYVTAKFTLAAVLLLPLLLRGSRRFAGDTSFTCLDAVREKG